MRQAFTVPITKPSAWSIPFGDAEETDNVQLLTFRVTRDTNDSEKYKYWCADCMNAGGEWDDLFSTSSLHESQWVGEESPTMLAHEMYAHGRQHEILWRWARRQPVADSPEELLQIVRNFPVGDK